MDNKQRLDELNKEIHQLHEERYTIEKLIDEELRKELFASDLLQKSEWKITNDLTNNTMRLHLALMSSNADDYWKYLQGSAFDLTPQIYLSGNEDDNDVWIGGDYDEMISFIHEYKLKIQGEYFDCAITELKEQIERVELLKQHVFGH